MALQIQNQLLIKVSGDASNHRNFVAIHLRAFDQPCLIEKLTPKQLLRKIHFFKFQIFDRRNSLVYLMTDAKNSSQHVSEIRHAIEPFFLTTAVAEVFREEWLPRDGSLVFAVEIQLQNGGLCLLELQEPRITYQEKRRGFGANQMQRQKP